MRKVNSESLETFLSARDGDTTGNWASRTIPLRQSVPTVEQHSLGAFVAGGQLCRHGLWVHMAVGLTHREIADLLVRDRFAMVGITRATRKSV
ncbi:MAG: hypothetical protein RI571_15945, partial [Roseovarius sp.]|nr:hypothetical protein [Roseovarius sp.]